MYDDREGDNELVRSAQEHCWIEHGLVAKAFKRVLTARQEFDEEVWIIDWFDGNRYGSVYNGTSWLMDM